MNGDDNILLNIGSTFIDPSASVTDNKDDSIKIVTDNVIDTSVAGTYTVTYSATDYAGNTSSVTRTVTVANLNQSLQY